MGLMETSPSGRVPLGHYDEGENVRDFDERGQRQRTASRSGLLRMGDGSPCPNGTPLVHMLTATRALSKRRFVNLTDTAQDDTTPASLAVQWSTTLDGTVVATAVDQNDVLYALTSGGEIYQVDDDGESTLALVVSAPTDFDQIPALHADPFGGLIVGYSNPLNIDGGASRFYRYTVVDDIWDLDFEEIVFPRVTKFWGDGSDIFAVGERPTNETLGIDYGLSRFGGVNTAGWSTTWERAAPRPLIDLAVTTSGVYGAAPANDNRAPSTDLTAEVDWTPREMTNAEERLFSAISAFRERNVRSLTDGDAVSRMEDARFDASSQPDVLDTTERVWASVQGVDPPAFLPVFRRDKDGRGWEVSFERPAAFKNGDPAAPWYRSSNHTLKKIKDAATDEAPWQRSLIPLMVNSTDAVKFYHVMLFRIEDHGTEDEWHTVFDFLGYSLRYRRPTGTSDLVLRLDIPGTDGVRDITFSDVDQQYVCSTLRCEGWGETGSEWWVNGVRQGATFTMPEPTTGTSWTYFASAAEYDRDDAPNPSGDETIVGGLKESWVVLADSTGGTVHEDALDNAEIQEVEGFVCNAHACQDILDGSHPWDGGAPSGAGDTEAAANYEEEQGLFSPSPLAFRLDRSTGFLRWVLEGDTVGEGIAAYDGKVWTAGDDGAGNGTIRRWTDDLVTPTEDWTVDAAGAGLGDFWLNHTASSVVPMVEDRCGGLLVTWASDPPSSDRVRLRRVDEDGDLDWDVILTEGANVPEEIHTAGLFIDDTALPDGACGPEYVLVPNSGGAERVDVIGRQLTGETRDTEVEQVAFCESGAIARLTEGGEWEAISGSFIPGERPWSFDFFGRYYIGSPDQYLVYQPEFKRVRDWTPAIGSAIPSRIRVATRWRGRVLAVSEDTPHIIFGSRVGDALDWNTGGDIIDAAQAFAGTNAESGQVPDPIVSIMPANDDLCYLGTTRSVFRLTGDPLTGGTLDDILATEGVFSAFSWCRGDSGEQYWLTTSFRVVQMTGNGLADLSSQFVYGRLQGIDPSAYRVELHWSQRMQGLYVIKIPRGGTLNPDEVHLFWSKRTGRWHPTRFGGGPARAVASAVSLDVADKNGWGVAFGGADGLVRVEHPEALDDDGVPIEWNMRLPMGGDGDPQRTLVTHAELVLDPTQGPCRVQGVAGRTGQEGLDIGPGFTAQPGRGNSVPVQIAGNHTWLLLSGVEPFALDDLAVHIHPWGAH